MTKKLNGSKDLLKEPSYDPDRLLNTLLFRFKLKNDAELARTLHMAPPMISKLRHRRMPVTAEVLLRIHDVTAMPIPELRSLMGVQGFQAA